MSYDSRNQYWVASNGLDWESIAVGAIAGGSAGNLPLMLASPDYDGEYRRGAVQSRSIFLEGTYDFIPDTLRLIAGARYNDDRSSAITTPIAVGGLLLANNPAQISPLRPVLCRSARRAVPIRRSSPPAPALAGPAHSASRPASPASRTA